eukprot:5611713-Amphidinium_carterae.1
MPLDAHSLGSAWSTREFSASTSVLLAAALVSGSVALPLVVSASSQELASGSLRVAAASSPAEYPTRPPHRTTLPCQELGRCEQKLPSGLSAKNELCYKVYTPCLLYTSPSPRDRG